MAKNFHQFFTSWPVKNSPPYTHPNSPTCRTHHIFIAAQQCMCVHYTNKLLDVGLLATGYFCSEAVVVIQKCKKICGLGCVPRALAFERFTQTSPYIYLHFCIVLGVSLPPCPFLPSSDRSANKSLQNFHRRRSSAGELPLAWRQWQPATVILLGKRTLSIDCTYCRADMSKKVKE